jgi:3-isopropylmalate dehydrogenase
MSASTINLAVIPGDGIGPEVIAEALKVLEKVVAAEGVTLDQTHYKLGAQHWLETGETLPEAVLEDLKTRDVILFGAIGAAPGDTRIPSGLIERELLLKLRFSLDHYVNLRPSRLYGTVGSPLAEPGNIDFIVVREGTEGPYVGNGGTLRAGTPHEVATEVSLNTAHGVERRCPRCVPSGQRAPAQEADAGPQAQRAGLCRPPVEAHCRGRGQGIPRGHPRLPAHRCRDHLHGHRSRPLDVIVTDNLFGDIITDLAAAVTGGIGLAASGNINMDRTAPSMFEPVHGSAPDIAGQQKADPTAAILSAALLLDHLGYSDAARRIESAVVADVEGRNGEVRSTSAIGDAIAAAV